MERFRNRKRITTVHKTNIRTVSHVHCPRAVFLHSIGHLFAHALPQACKQPHMVYRGKRYIIVSTTSVYQLVPVNPCKAINSA